jgi:hypothetical protein
VNLALSIMVTNPLLIVDNSILRHAIDYQHNNTCMYHANMLAYINQVLTE